MCVCVTKENKEIIVNVISLFHQDEEDNEYNEKYRAVRVPTNSLAGFVHVINRRVNLSNDPMPKKSVGNGNNTHILSKQQQKVNDNHATGFSYRPLDVVSSSSKV